MEFDISKVRIGMESSKEFRGRVNIIVYIGNFVDGDNAFVDGILCKGVSYAEATRSLMMYMNDPQQYENNVRRILFP